MSSETPVVELTEGTLETNPCRISSAPECTFNNVQHDVSQGAGHAFVITMPLATVDSGKKNSGIRFMCNCGRTFQLKTGRTHDRGLDARELCLLTDFPEFLMADK